ncbi:phosphotransferase [Paenibacillus macerans]|uniref:phosphotransferase n=1 Tax=Paenibacillus macerans TaxID=44252 RepID=UPI000EDAAFDA|nr:phosphotransferase [Paenibacillus macerans]UMV49171.1 phosphotransferase [Paenibacillus macerans]GBK65294.1 hypothetical protein PbDSM24746_52980 [Paenibacillus macerans]GBK71529.1 hypothetical protein PbJCM17693_52370 [Paenibacillus macerans]GIP09559.1 hypothetical protein J1TS5_17290 [Paenibacillus macerans]
MAPRVVHYDIDKRYIITEFINSVDNGNNQEEKIKSLAKKLKLFHKQSKSYNNKIFEFKKEYWFDKYEALPLKMKDDFKEVYYIILNQDKTFLNKDRVVSHNDFHKSNVLFDGSSTYIIDFDHLGYNSKYFDLATISISLCLQPRMEHVLLSNYGSDYNYDNFTYQKIICAAQYALSSVALVNDAKKFVDLSVAERRPFSWDCSEFSEINISRYKLAYNFLNYFKSLKRNEMFTC